MITSTVSYKGGLHTQAVHLKSGTVVETDAPVDNKGKGECFSPTDLCATSLATCMLTIMGILAEEKNLPFAEADAQVTKIMAAEPRRIATIEITISIQDLGLSEKEKAMLENAARNCPVAKSLHPDIWQDVRFIFYTR
jgi:uncharacterized OsmC-like protein